MPSFSTRTIVYKGLLLATQVGSFYPDLTNPLCVSALGLVHQLFHQHLPELEAGAPVPLHRA
jgi:glutamate synthase (NADPH/NADH) large chain